MPRPTYDAKITESGILALYRPGLESVDGSPFPEKLQERLRDVGHATIWAVFVTAFVGQRLPFEGFEPFDEREFPRAAETLERAQRLGAEVLAVRYSHMRPEEVDAARNAIGVAYEHVVAPITQRLAGIEPHSPHADELDQARLDNVGRLHLPPGPHDIYNWDAAMRDLGLAAHVEHTATNP